MFGIVIVSHSRKLAESLARLASEVSRAEIPLAFAGGVEGKYDESGTDATDILAALESVYSDEGVIIFTDMGSSLLGAELALELTGVEKRKNIHISPAPLVEGALAAAVQCGAGSDIAFALSEAEKGAEAKKIHLSGGTVPPAGLSVKGGQEEALRAESTGERPGGGSISAAAGNAGLKEMFFTVRNRNGLHARPAADFIRAVAGSGCSVNVFNTANGRGPADGRSFSALSSLEVLAGNRIRVTAAGAGAEKLFSALQKLFEENFGENEPSSALPSAALPETAAAAAENDAPFAFSAGIASGHVFILEQFSFDIEKRGAKDIDAEKIRFTEALIRAEKKIKERSLRLSRQGNKAGASILKAIDSMIDDPELVDFTLKMIETEKCSAEYAASESIRKIISSYKNISDSYLRQRESDIRDFGALLLEQLGWKSSVSEAEERSLEGAIVAAQDITPAQTEFFHRKKIAGFLLSEGSLYSHAAIMSRSLGIPGIGRYRGALKLEKSDYVLIDCYAGQVFVNPDNETMDLLSEKKKSIAEKEEAARKKSSGKAFTLDNIHVPVYANISSAEEALIAVKNGADGAGLVRTELLFVNSEREPSEEEQYSHYLSIFMAMDKRVVTIRTLDAGGDKIVPFMDIPEGENPSLGMRGVRLYTSNRAIITRQIRAILRAASGFEVNIMFPMIVRDEEVEICKTLLFNAHTQLEREKVSHKWPIETGIMIETPAAAVTAHALAKHSDFFSIGTNDLTQYAMAAERGNSRLSPLSDPLNPAVIRLIYQASLEGRKAGLRVGICGEIGSEPSAAALVIGLGISSISTVPEKIPFVKNAVSSSSFSESVHAALEVVSTAENTEDVKKIMNRKLMKN